MLDIPPGQTLWFKAPDKFEKSPTPDLNKAFCKLQRLELNFGFLVFGGIFVAGIMRSEDPKNMQKNVQKMRKNALSAV